MRSPCTRVGPKSSVRHPYKRKGEKTQRHRWEGHVEKEAEIRVMLS